MFSSYEIFSSWEMLILWNKLSVSEVTTLQCPLSQLSKHPLTYTHIHTMHGNTCHEYCRSGIFMLKIIRAKNVHVAKFSQFCSIHEILTVNSCNMDERLESSRHLVYYQISGQPGIARCNRRSDIYLGDCGLARKLIHWSSPCNFVFRMLKWISRLDSTAKIF